MYYVQDFYYYFFLYGIIGVTIVLKMCLHMKLLCHRTFYIYLISDFHNPSSTMIAANCDQICNLLF